MAAMLDIGLMDFRAHLRLLEKTGAVNTIREVRRLSPESSSFEIQIHSHDFCL